MAPKRKAAPTQAHSEHPRRSHNPFKDRMGLGAYLEDPAAYPSSVVLYYNDDFVAIRDKFPKATIHTLLLPRSAAHNMQHPFAALADPVFLEKVRTETRRLKDLVAAELQRTLGSGSRAEAARQAVLDGADPGSTQQAEEGDPDNLGPDGLPRGRDWHAEVMCGVHAVPSMTHLHIHVLSRDMHSPALKHRKHYNSFTTPFLVDIADFPLAKDDLRRDTKQAGYLRWDLKCWRCGKNFGNQFQQLKAHLDKEFEEWKRE